MDSKYEPNLLNNSVSYDHIREKSKNMGTENDSAFVTAQPSSGGGDPQNLMEEIMKNLDKLDTTETDMGFYHMANPDKLVPEDQIKNFEKTKISKVQSETQDTDKNAYRTETYNSPHNTETINDYTKKEDLTQSSQFIPFSQNNIQQQQQSQQQYEKQRTYEQSSQEYSPPPPNASVYGPSYGNGPTIHNKGTNKNNISSDNDKYYGFGSEEELNLAKLNMLRNLGELAQHGVKLSQNYSMNSDYKSMKFEYELHRSIRDKHNGVRWLSLMLTNSCWGLELANENFNPFEFKLKGWSEQINEEIDEYYDVLGEIYEKYFKSGRTVPPELKLAFLIGGSAAKFHMANTYIEKIPPLDEELKHNPELARKLSEQVAMNEMKEKYNRQKESNAQKMNEQHDNAKKKAEDLQMLKEKHDEYLKMQQQTIQNNAMQQQQEIMRQQMAQHQMMQQQILDKQRQLEELQKQLSMQRSDTRSMYTSGTVRTQKTNGNTQQQTLRQPIIPASLRNKNFSLINRGNYKDNTNNDEKDYDNVSIDPNIDNIINNSLVDIQSVDSNTSKKSQINRKNKNPNIRIDT